MGDTPRREGPPDYRGLPHSLLQVILFVLGSLVLASMAIGAHTLAYFPGDVSISHAVQSYTSDWLDAALGAVSWAGFPPQSDVLFGVIVALLFVLGARWAAVNGAIAAIGSGGLYLLIEHVVAQPRPSSDLVRVVGPIQMTGFPSGHLATFVAVFGFLAFLGYRRLLPSSFRWVPVALVAGLLAVMSFARIYAGHHWASDVLARRLVRWPVASHRDSALHVGRTVRLLALQAPYRIAARPASATRHGLTKSTRPVEAAGANRTSSQSVTAWHSSVNRSGACCRHHRSPPDKSRWRRLWRGRGAKAASVGRLSAEPPDVNAPRGDWFGPCRRVRRADREKGVQ